MSLTLLLGGARSGKSRLAVRMASAGDRAVVFLATAVPEDADMAARIARHREERPGSWTTLEDVADLAETLAGIDPEATVVVDCLTMWVASLLDLGDADVLDRARRAAAVAASRPGPTIAVSNEVGMGIVPGIAVARRYRDLLGRVNTLWAETASRVLLVVAGRTLELEAWDAP